MYPTSNLSIYIYVFCLQVSILFTDIVGFTTISSRLTPLQVLTMLNGVYHEFDNLTEKNNLYKVETIGDAYMCIGGNTSIYLL